jgi:hypothetical protein
MRDLLAHADLSRYAGQFVWLEISYDDSRNREFLARYGATATPTFFVINAQDETVVAMQLGSKLQHAQKACLRNTDDFHRVIKHKSEYQHA